MLSTAGALIVSATGRQRLAAKRSDSVKACHPAGYCNRVKQEASLLTLPFYRRPGLGRLNTTPLRCVPRDARLRPPRLDAGFARRSRLRWLADLRC